MRRVVVTGLGIVSPLGIGVEKTWKRLLQGACGIDSLKKRRPGVYDALPATIAGLVSESEFKECKKDWTVKMIILYENIPLLSLVNTRRFLVEY
jgi:3-oxoacyl-(acyl-carrier-protein) synthase